MQEVSLRDENGINVQSVMHARISELLEIAKNEAGTASTLNVKKIGNMIKFLDLCQDNGLGNSDFIDHLKKGMAMCEEKNDTRTMHKFMILWKDLVLSVESQVSSILGNVKVENFQKNVQNNIGAGESVEDMEKELEAINGEIEKDYIDTL